MNQVVRNIFLASLLLVCAPLSAAVVVEDDLGRRVELPKPAQRIISLAPHITENLFSAGAGDKVVGVVSYSNFPEQALNIASVGSYKQFNLEAIAALQPDLIVAWRSGNGMAKIQQLIDLGFTVYVTEPATLDLIPTSIERYAALVDASAAAQPVVQTYRDKLAALRARYSQQSPVSVFYQVWNQPLQTLNGEHLISDVIRLCGGRNVFADAKALAPRVGVESILVADPQVIIASGMGESRPEWLDEWLQWPSLQAVTQQHLYFVPPDYVQRHTLRILVGAEMMCKHLERAR